MEKREGARMSEGTQRRVGSWARVDCVRSEGRRQESWAIGTKRANGERVRERLKAGSRWGDVRMYR